MSPIRDTLLAAAIGLVLASPISASAAEFEWKYFTFFNANDFAAKMEAQFAKDLTDATGGRLNVTLYSAGELPYKLPEVMRAVATDQIQLGHMGISTVAGELPGLQVTDLPFLCGSFDQFYDAMKVVEPVTSQRMQEKFGVMPLMTWTMPAAQLWLSKPIEHPEDLSGRKVRIYSSIHEKLFSNFGVVGVSLTSAEITPALDRGVIEGVITTAIPALDWRFPELASYGYMMNISFAQEMLIVNKSELEKLPEDLRQIVLEKTKEWNPKFREMIAAEEKRALDALSEKGQTFLTPKEEDLAKLVSLSEPIWEEWAKTNDDARMLVDKVKVACGKE